MIIQVTYEEGGEWNQIDSHYMGAEYPYSAFAAVKIGDWVYDSVLKKRGYNPIRFAHQYAGGNWIDREGD